VIRLTHSRDDIIEEHRMIPLKGDRMIALNDQRLDDDDMI
jgi:hypothetical protein